MTDPSDTFDIERADPGGGNDPSLTHHGILIRPSHQLQCEIVRFPTDYRQGSLQWLYDTLECRSVDIQLPLPGSYLYRLGGPDCWFADDESVPLLEPNHTATHLMGWPYPIVGNVLLTAQDRGHTAPLPIAWIHEITARYPAIPVGSTAD